jgi:hypothetical protein
MSNKTSLSIVEIRRNNFIPAWAKSLNVLNVMKEIEVLIIDIALVVIIM